MIEPEVRGDAFDYLLNAKLRLSDTERQVLHGYITGEDDKSIALRLGIQKKDVRAARNNVYHRAGHEVMKFQRYKYQLYLLAEEQNASIPAQNDQQATSN